MATTYKTPGVYIEEIPKFPPSIAPVDTAIPAFIGYTERAVDRDGSDLTLRPKRIESLVEYEQYFGGPQPETGITVTVEEVTVATLGKPVGVTATAALDEGDRSKHILYYAMQLFYANGGKSCYVVSVEPYKATVGDDLDVGRARQGAAAAGEGRRADPDRGARGAGARPGGRLRHAAEQRADPVRAPSRTASSSWTCTVAPRRSPTPRPT